MSVGWQIACGAEHSHRCDAGLDLCVASLFSPSEGLRYVAGQPCEELAFLQQLPEPTYQVAPSRNSLHGTSQSLPALLSNQSRELLTINFLESKRQVRFQTKRRQTALPPWLNKSEVVFAIPNEARIPLAKWDGRSRLRHPSP